jgi:hypothetical protein
MILDYSSGAFVSIAEVAFKGEQHQKVSKILPGVSASV